MKRKINSWLLIINIFILFFVVGCQKTSSLELSENSDISNIQWKEEKSYETKEQQKDSFKNNEMKEDKKEKNYNSKLKNPYTEKPGIVFSFDDRSIYDWYSLRNLFKENKVTATFFISKPQELSETQVQMLKILEKEGHEIGAHSTEHLNLEKYLENHTIEEYIDEEIIFCKENLEGKGYTIDSYAFPFGIRTKELEEKLEGIFPCSRGTAHTNETIRLKDLDNIYFSCGEKHPFTIGAGIDEVYENTSEEIEQALNRAKENNEIVVFYSHHVFKDDSYTTSFERFEEIIEKARELDLEFYTIRNLAGMK